MSEQAHKEVSHLQVHVMIEYCLLLGLDALQTENLLLGYGVPCCMTRIGMHQSRAYQKGMQAHALF